MNKIKSFIIKHRILTLAIIFLLGIGLGYLFLLLQVNKIEQKKEKATKYILVQCIHKYGRINQENVRFVVWI